MAVTKRATTSLSLLIGPKRIHAVQMGAATGRPELLHVVSADTPPGAVDGGAIRDPERLGQAIRTLLRSSQIKAAQATVVLPTTGYELRTLRLPEVPLAERRILVRGELEAAGVLPVYHGAFDFLWVAAPTQEGRRQADVYAFYTTDQIVDTVHQVLRQAGLRLARLEPVFLSLARIGLARQTPRQAVAILCPFQDFSDLCIHDGTGIRYLRRIPAGWKEAGLGQELVAEAAEEALPPEAAPATSRASLNLMGPSPGPSRKLGTVLPAPARSPLAVKPVPIMPSPDEYEGMEFLRPETPTSFLEAELTRSLAFYAREYADAAAPERLLILGPPFAAEALRILIAGNASLPVTSDDPLAAYPLPAMAAVADAAEHDAYLAALGAALDLRDEALPALDVSQQEAAARTRRRAPNVLLAGMAGSTAWMIAAAIAASIFALLQLQLQTEDTRLGQQITALNAQRAPLIAYWNNSNAAHALAGQDQLPVRSALGRLAASTTPGVALTSVHVGADGKVSVEGQALDSGSTQQFVLALGQSTVIKSPTFEMMRQDVKGGVQFRIIGQFRAPAPPVVAAPATP